VTVGALHAQRRRDVLHRQLQLVEGDVFQDLKIFGGLRTTAAPAGPGRLLGPLRRSLWRVPGAQARARGNGYEQDGRDQEPAEGLYDQRASYVRRARDWDGYAWTVRPVTGASANGLQGLDGA
jgi:hypothetical protein